MTVQQDPYVRVPYRVLSDERFKRLPDAAWGLWVRLAIIADGMYPSPAPLPRNTSDDSLLWLVTNGIVELDGDMYVMVDMAEERAKREEGALFAAEVKHHGKDEALRRRSGRMRAHAGAESSDAAAVPAHASPIRSAPLQSEPLLSVAREGGAGPHDPAGASSHADTRSIMEKLVAAGLNPGILPERNRS